MPAPPPRSAERQLDDEHRALARAATPPTRGRRWPRRTPGRSPARARAAVRRVAVSAMERLEDVRQQLGRDAGPAIDHADHQPAAGHARAELDRDGRRRSAARSRCRFANTRSSCAASARTSGRSAVERDLHGHGRGRRGRAPPRRTSSIEHQSRRGSASPACSRERSSSLSISRDSRSASSTTTAPSSSPLGRLDRRRADRVAGGEDRRQRRAQVVRDGAQQRGLDHVRAPQGLRLDDLRLQPRRAPAPRPAAPRSAGATRSRRRAVDLGRQAVGQRATSAPRPSATSASLRGSSTIVANGRPSAEASRAEATGSASATLGLAEQHARELGGEVGLLAPPLGLDRAAARERRHEGRGERGGEEHEDRDPVLRRGDRQPARRRQMEEVPRHGAPHRGREARATAPTASRPAARRGGRARPSRPPGRPPATGRSAAVVKRDRGGRGGEARELRRAARHAANATRRASGCLRRAIGRCGCGRRSWPRTARRRRGRARLSARSRPSHSATPAEQVCPSGVSARMRSRTCTASSASQRGSSTRNSSPP